MRNIYKLLLKILSVSSYANISFDDLCNILKNLDFDFRTKGSHHVFRKVGAEEEINLQKDWAKAKPYQAIALGLPEYSSAS